MKGNDYPALENMDQYIGTKISGAKPMTRLEYNQFRGWELPADECGDDKGYVVQYTDNYVSWSPAEQFEEAYRKTNEMTFGLALEAMHKGHKVARTGWNGKGMFIVLMPPLYLPPFNTSDTARKVNDRTAKWIGEDKPLDCQPYFAMYTATKQWQPGWLASQADMLAEDWVIDEKLTEATPA